VLQEFQVVFVENATLSPRRDCDHEIHLKDDGKHPNVRPYIVLHKQKEDVEKFIKTMLQESTIRSSNSPYASPAILVKKRWILKDVH
jgi:hypothetical protein